MPNAMPVTQTPTRQSIVTRDFLPEIQYFYALFACVGASIYTPLGVKGAVVMASPLTLSSPTLPPPKVLYNLAGAHDPTAFVKRSLSVQIRGGCVVAAPHGRISIDVSDLHGIRKDTQPPILFCLRRAASCLGGPGAEKDRSAVENSEGVRNRPFFALEAGGEDRAGSASSGMRVRKRF